MSRAFRGSRRTYIIDRLDFGDGSGETLLRKALLLHWHPNSELIMLFFDSHPVLLMRIHGRRGAVVAGD